MASHNKHKTDLKTIIVRIISLSLAVLMVLSVVMTTMWR